MFNLDNQFWHFMREDWLVRDPLLIIAGTVAIAINLLRGLRDRIALVVGLLGLLALYYLARGGLVFNFYILFALPFFALNIAVAGRAAVRPHEALAVGHRRDRAGDDRRAGRRLVVERPGPAALRRRLQPGRPRGDRLDQEACAAAEHDHRRRRVLARSARPDTRPAGLSEHP